MKLKYKIYEVAAIVLTCFCFTKSNPIQENTTISSNDTPKLPSKSNLLSLLSMITSVESNGKNAKHTIKDHLADVLETNQKFTQNFKISRSLNDPETSIADGKKIITKSTTNVRTGSLLRSNASKVINSTTDSSRLAPTSTERSSLQAENATASATDNPTITIRTKKPVSLSPAEMQQIIDIANNRRQGARDASDSAAETAMKMMVKNQLNVEDALEMMRSNFNPADGADQLDVAMQLARNGPQNEMADNNLGNDAIFMPENNLGNIAEMQMMANQAAGKTLAQNNFGGNNANDDEKKNRFRVDDADIKLMEDEAMDKLGQDALMKMLGRSLPPLVPSTTEALSIEFDDSDTLHTLNDSLSESGSIWQTYETAEASTKFGRKCFQCQPEIQTPYRDPRIPWICGGYNHARRSFKSICMMQMRNCQDGTMFVKLHDNKCPVDTPEEPFPHGKTFFYDYPAPLSFESDNNAFAESLPSEVEEAQVQAIYEDFNFFGRKGKKKKKNQ